jgi:catechol 2,3-dioxygenase-like lactoylglutathione lyase family enzyme
MALEGLDHVTLATNDLDRSLAFYEGALGLVRGERPPFGFPGAWLYCGGRPVVHLIGGRGHAGGGSGPVDHVAFRASGLAATLARLKARAIAHDLRLVPGQGLRQVFVHDPDGVRIELNFAADEPLEGT